MYVLMHICVLAALNERIVNVSSSLLSYYNLDDPVSLCIPSQVRN